MSATDARGAPWLSIVGIGEDGLSGVAPAPRRLIEEAALLIGGARHLAMIPDDHPAERLTWKSPLADTVADIRAAEGRAVCVLATGDPMSYGIGVTLGREFGRAALSVHPVAGAFSLAAARMGWSLEEVARLTLHGRPLSLLNLYLQPGRRLLILSEDGGTPARVAAVLTEAGFGPSAMTVLAHLGGADESRRAGTAADWPPDGASSGAPDLNTIAVDLAPAPEAVWHPTVPGLPDDAFRHDGQLTKREVRAATLAALAPRPGALLWDVGAGCGSIALEWMRAGGRAIAVEREAARRALIAENAERLGTPHLRIADGAAPGALADLPAPDAIFLGGGLTDDDTISKCFAALRPGGRFVANAVTLEGEARLAALMAERGGAMTRIAVSRLAGIGPYHGWRPLMPVTQYGLTKPHSVTDTK